MTKIFTVLISIVLFGMLSLAMGYFIAVALTGA